MSDLFSISTIVVAIVLQLMVIGICTKFKSANISKHKHMIMMWIVVACSILFAVCIARTITSLTWDDLKVIDNSSVLLPCIPIFTMFLWWTIFSDCQAETPLQNICVLYVFVVVVLLLHDSGLPSMFFDLISVIFDMFKIFVPYILIAVIIVVLNSQIHKSSKN